jgi:hypothetical protein
MYKTGQLIILITGLSLLMGCASTGTPYVKVGAGYKIHESEVKWKVPSSISEEAYKVSGRAEVGIETDSISYGISHHSQIFAGAPFNSDQEYTKTELFVDYKFTF